VSGQALASSQGEETVLIAEIDPARADQKRRIMIPGVYETDNFATRQPGLYEILSKPAT
jgi:hypothetical protein